MKSWTRSRLGDAGRISFDIIASGRRMMGRHETPRLNPTIYCLPGMDIFDPRCDLSEPDHLKEPFGMIPISAAELPVRFGRVAARLVCCLTQGVAALIAAALLLSACTNPSTTALGTNVPLAPAPDLAGAASPGSVVWRSPDLAEHERGASSYLIPPATVYRGQGAYFPDLSPQQVDSIAADLTRDVRAEVGRRFRVVNAAGPGVFTLELILLKAVPPHQQYVKSGPYDVANLAVGMPNEGLTTAGSLTVAGKFIDSATSKLLVGFSSPVSPQMMDPPARGTRWTSPRWRASNLPPIWSRRSSVRGRTIRRWHQNNRLPIRQGRLAKHARSRQPKNGAIINKR